MPQDVLKSYARTVVPLVVGWLVSLALRHGVDLHGDTSQVTVVVTVAYYVLVRAAEHYLSPSFGWLLGWAGSPAYASAPAVAGEGDAAP